MCGLVQGKSLQQADMAIYKLFGPIFNGITPDALACEASIDSQVSRDKSIDAWWKALLSARIPCALQCIVIAHLQNVLHFVKVTPQYVAHLQHSHAVAHTVTQCTAIARIIHCTVQVSAIKWLCMCPWVSAACSAKAQLHSTAQGLSATM